IHVEFSSSLVAMVLDPATGLDARIVNMRNHVAAVYGLILPEIRLTDDALLEPGEYRIRIHGVEQARDRLVPDHALALVAGAEDRVPDGRDVREPVYVAPARWLPAIAQEYAAIAGVPVVCATADLV